MSKVYAIKITDPEWLKSHSIIENMVIEESFNKYGDDHELTTEDWDMLYYKMSEGYDWYIPYIQIWEMSSNLFTEDIVKDINKVEYGLPKKDYGNIYIPFKYELVEVKDNG